MEYKEAIDWLFGTQQFGIKLGLEGPRVLLKDFLAFPKHGVKVAHVAGTNGKGSVCAMMERVARACGRRTGLFTSPHLIDYRERIQVSGEMISEERCAELLTEVRAVCERLETHPTFFEITLAVAMRWFGERSCELIILETGMGGRLDATTAVPADVCVITPIGMDHAEYLGNTIELIAAEKAGIIKPGGLVVVAEQEPAAMSVIADRVAEVGARAVIEGRDFAVVGRTLAVGGQMVTLQGLGGVYDELWLPLHGEHQAHNAAVALAAFECFLGGGQHRLDLHIVREAFLEATSPGRLEVLRRSPTVLVDAAHNPHGARASAEALKESFDFGSVIAVVGVMREKDLEGILAAFADQIDVVVATAADDSRAMPADEVGRVAAELFGGDRVMVVPDVASALEHAIGLADEATHDGAMSSAVVVLGSIALAGQARAVLGSAQ